MEIRNNAEALKAFLGVSSSQPAKSPALNGSEAEKLRAAFKGDEAKLSGLGAAMQSAVGHDAVRMDKVAEVQRALAAGTYNVPATEVADKVIQAMLGAGVEAKGK
jgi:negative regulator of flagellin synthesis FlgM